MFALCLVAQPDDDPAAGRSGPAAACACRTRRATAAPTPADTTAAAATGAYPRRRRKKAEVAAQVQAAQALGGIVEEMARSSSRAGRPRCNTGRRRASANKVYPSVSGRDRGRDEGPAARSGPRGPRRASATRPRRWPSSASSRRRRSSTSGPGDFGWYTELLAPTLSRRKGKYYATGNDPNGQDPWSPFGAKTWAGFLARAPEVYGNVQTVVVADDNAPKLDIPDGSLDMVLAMRELHGWVSGEGSGKSVLAPWLAEVQRVLKPGGVFGVEEHRAKPDADPAASALKGYLPEKWVIAQVEGAGFKLAGKSEINANAKDTKDYAEGVWTLPPVFTLKEKDHDKYAAIGESDRMTLKFVKVAPAASAKPAATK